MQTADKHETVTSPPWVTVLQRRLRVGSAGCLVIGVMLLILTGLILAISGSRNEFLPIVFLTSILCGGGALFLQFMLTLAMLHGRARFSLRGMLYTTLTAAAAVSAIVSDGIVLKGLGVGVLLVMIFVIHEYARRSADE